MSNSSINSLSCLTMPFLVWKRFTFLCMEKCKTVNSFHFVCCYREIHPNFETRLDFFDFDSLTQFLVLIQKSGISIVTEYVRFGKKVRGHMRSKVSRWSNRNWQKCMVIGQLTFCFLTLFLL